jgi:hypothetical protein
MATLRKAVLATAMISTGLVSSAGIALADDHGGDGHTVQKGLVNSSDFAPNTTGDLCNNDVPVNAVGGQVPVQDIAAGVPVLSSAGSQGVDLLGIPLIPGGDSHGHGSGNGAANAKSCGNGIAANN